MPRLFGDFPRPSTIVTPSSDAWKKAKIVSGRAYRWSYIQDINTSSPYAFFSDQLWFFPWDGPEGTYDAIKCYCSYTGSGNGVMGLYSYDSETGFPKELIVQTSAFSLGSTGEIAQAITAQVLTEPFYWLGFNHGASGSPSFYYAKNSLAGPGRSGLFGRSSGSSWSNTGNNAYDAFKISHSYTGTLPAAPTVSASDGQDIGYGPLLMMEAA